MHFMLFLIALSQLSRNEASHEVEVDEEIGNFDSIHRELVERKRAPYVSEPPDSEFYVPPPEEELLMPKITDHKKIRSKRSEPESDGDAQHMNLLSHFDIKSSTIIRTQDSRAKGAEFLNETRKASNNDCLLWCLEVNQCNVAVFAEKNGKTCYLFDCGPRNYFRCQFTTHDHYISSVLNAPSDDYQFRYWKSQIKHENELASLRQTPLPATSTTTVAAENVPRTVEPLTPTSAAPTPQRNAPAAKLEINTEAPPVCKHYQFQCHHGKECIAIYNVCDGIPQCSDQSDEAEDLKCPTNTIPVRSDVQAIQPAIPDKRPLANMDRLPETPNQGNPKPPNKLQEGFSEAGAGGLMKQLEGSSSGAGSWGPGNYQVEGENHGADEYSGSADRDAVGNNYQQSSHVHPSFSNRHSSFLAAGNQYHPEVGSGYPMGQYGGYYHGETYDRQIGKPPPDGQSLPSGLSHANSDFDYNHYENNYHKSPPHPSYDSHTNFDSSYRPLDTNPDSVPVEKYRPPDRIWPPDQPNPRGSGYPLKSDESQMVPYDAAQKVPQSRPYLSR